MAAKTAIYAGSQPAGGRHWPDGAYMISEYQTFRQRLPYFRNDLHILNLLLMGFSSSIAEGDLISLGLSVTILKSA